jgi:sigma-B regulation protein RsbU (phosphoserine phosphatase)
MRNIRAAMNRGAFDFLTKPIDFHDFEVTVQKTLAQVRHLRAAAADRDRLVALERDLKIASSIQRSFLPAAPPPDDGRSSFAVHAAMIPAQAVGGDFYDYFPLDDCRLGVVIGDVAGKGVPAALLMAVTRTLLRACATRDDTPGACLEEVNRLLLRDTSADRFVTLFYGVLDAQKGELRYANAGHNPPLLLHTDGTVEPLPGGGLVVGLVPKTTYETRTVRIEPGDRLFLYTDGIPEAMDARRKQFSAERMETVLRDSGAANPEELIGRVVESVRQFAAGAPQSDDLTALAALYRHPGGCAGGEGP